MDDEELLGVRRSGVLVDRRSRRAAQVRHLPTHGERIYPGEEARWLGEIDGVRTIVPLDERRQRAWPARVHAFSPLIGLTSASSEFAPNPGFPIGRRARPPSPTRIARGRGPAQGPKAASGAPAK